MTWETVPLLHAVRDVTRNNLKIQSSATLSHGALPVVDQGKNLIAGFTDNLSAKVKTNAPIIVFGDHTRALKYVDFPFAMGADGTKLLIARAGFDSKFVFRFLESVDLSNFGYARHFKHLKEVRVPLAPEAEQRRIAAILDQADEVRAKRRAQLAYLDELPQSLFHEMFGTREPGSRFEEVARIQGGLQVSAKRKGLPLQAPYLRVANVYRGRLDLAEIKTISLTQAELARTTLNSGDLLFVEGHGNPNEVGRVARWTGDIEGCTHQNHLIRARVDQVLASPTYIESWMNSNRGARYFQRSANTTSGLNTISASTVRSAPLHLPPLNEQLAFAEKIEAIWVERYRVVRALEANEELFAALQYRAFRGEL